MKFTPQQYRLPDIPMEPFIDPCEINDFLEKSRPERDKVREIIHKSLAKNRLSLPEVATLLNTRDPELIGEIKDAARKLKKVVYGDRIVLFAPLYVGNACTNDCSYCGFRVSNREAIRKTLDDAELEANVKALEAVGQKRLIMVYGEHPRYSADFIAHNVRSVYEVKEGPGEIRRVNINAAPFDIEGFRKIREAGIGTYQIFQETYHPEAYAKYHPRGKKSDYNWRLTALDRAQEAGQDDVGIGALFGLYDWRFEVMGLVRHTNHLEACYNIGPHTISFPRIKDAANGNVDPRFRISDEDFTLAVAILRLAVPYTGLILTAREPAAIRREVLQFGCSQIDAGTKIELGAYARQATQGNAAAAGVMTSDAEGAGNHLTQDLNREQFQIADNRSLNEVMEELLDLEYLPSFCTACYRLGRTGEHFMECSVPGFIKNCCTPNALLTLAEYLEDFAPAETAGKGWHMIEERVCRMNGSPLTGRVKERLERVRQGERDLYF